MPCAAAPRMSGHEPRVFRSYQLLRSWNLLSKTTNTFLPEMREHGVRLVLGNQGQHGSCVNTVFERLVLLEERNISQHFPIRSFKRARRVNANTCLQIKAAFLHVRGSRGDLRAGTA